MNNREIITALALGASTMLPVVIHQARKNKELKHFLVKNQRREKILRDILLEALDGMTAEQRAYVYTQVSDDIKFYDITKNL